MAKNKDLLYGRILILAHIVLVLAVLSSGYFAGLYFSVPYIHVGVKDLEDDPNTWYIKSTFKGSVATGGNFNTTIAFYNTSIFPITYEPQEVNIYYYPIGERPSCMFLHSDDNHFNYSSNNRSISQVFKTIDSSNERFFKINDLKVTLKSSRWDFTNPKYYELKWTVGFEVPSEKLNTIKSIYMDCAKFDKVVFSMELKENNLNYLFMKKNVKNTFELILPMNCSLDKSVHKLFTNLQVSREPVIFKDLQPRNLKFNYF